MTTIQLMIQQVAGLEGDSTRCPYCQGKKNSWITCPAHLVAGEYNVDPTTGYRWCWNCDTAEVKAPKISCPCTD